MKAHAAELGVGLTLVGAPYWITALQEVNVILGFASAILGLIVGAHAVYRLISDWLRKL